MVRVPEAHRAVTGEPLEPKLVSAGEFDRGCEQACWNAPRLFRSIALLDDARDVGVIRLDHGRHSLAVAFDKLGRQRDGGDFRREGIAVDLGKAAAALRNHPAVADQDGGAGAALAAAGAIDADENRARLRQARLSPPPLKTAP